MFVEYVNNVTSCQFNHATWVYIIITRNHSCNASNSTYSYTFIRSTVCLSVVCVLHLCTLLKLLDEFRCHLAVTLVGFNDKCCWMGVPPDPPFKQCVLDVSVMVTGQSGDRLGPGALPGNNFGQVVHTHVPLLTKQYNLVPVIKGRCCFAAEKLTVDLASHWPCIRDSVVYLPTGSVATEGQMSSLPMLRRGMARFTFLPPGEIRDFSQKMHYKLSQTTSFMLSQSDDVKQCL